MRIAIDAHSLGAKSGGKEIYTLNLVKYLAKIDKKNKYLLYLSQKGLLSCGLFKQPNFQTKLIKPDWRWIRAPFVIPLESRRFKTDLLHIQYFPPFNYMNNIISTIHDATLDSFPAYLRSKENFIR